MVQQGGGSQAGQSATFPDVIRNVQRWSCGSGKAGKRREACVNGSEEWWRGDDGGEGG